MSDRSDNFCLKLMNQHGGGSTRAVIGNMDREIQIILLPIALQCQAQEIGLIVGGDDNCNRFDGHDGYAVLNRPFSGSA